VTNAEKHEQKGQIDQPENDGSRCRNGNPNQRMMVELVVELHPSGLDDRCKSAPLRSGKVCNLVEFTMFGFHQELAFNSEKWIRMLI